MRGVGEPDTSSGPYPEGPLFKTSPPQQISPAAMSYRVYVIQNREGKFYIGLSDDVGRRIEQHNSGASKWTKTRGPWQLVWQSEVLSVSDARKLENRLKRKGRGQGFYSITGLHQSCS